jgi:hypothetical protein
MGKMLNCNVFCTERLARAIFVAEGWRQDFSAGGDGQPWASSCEGRGQVLNCQFSLRKPGTDNLGGLQARLPARFYLDLNRTPVNGDKSENRDGIIFGTTSKPSHTAKQQGG